MDLENVKMRMEFIMYFYNNLNQAYWDKGVY